MRISKLRPKNQNQSINDHNFSENDDDDDDVDDHDEDEDDNMMIILVPSSKNCNWGGLINISSIVSFRPPRHFFLHFLWYFFVIIVIVWQINKYKYKW